MNGKQHLTAGIVTGLISSPIVFQIAPAPAVASAALIPYIGLAALGALVPDIDKRGSMISRKFRLTSYVVSKSCGHRGIMHAPIVMTLLWLFTSTIVPSFWSVCLTGLYVGIMSHIILDGLTPMGIPLLYPFTKKKFRLGGFIFLGVVLGILYAVLV